MSDEQVTSTTAPAGIAEATLARAVITEAAAPVLALLQDKHGPVLFHQSGGCCEGSGPLCLRRGSFAVGPHDRLLGRVLSSSGQDPAGATDVWISSAQFAAWAHTQVVIDAVEGHDSGFSLEGPEGFVFLSRGRVFSPDELRRLPPAPSRAELDAGAVPPRALAPVAMVGTLAEACGLPRP